MSGSWELVETTPTFGAFANRSIVVSKRFTPKRSQYCFGMEARDFGQRRVPLPPQRMKGMKVEPISPEFISFKRG